MCVCVCLYVCTSFIDVFVEYKYCVFLQFSHFEAFKPDVNTMQSKLFDQNQYLAYVYFQPKYKDLVYLFTKILFTMGRSKVDQSTV